MSENLYIIIPAYNEAENIATTINEWHEIVSRVSPESRLFVIDDGSKDNTYSIMEKLTGQYPQLKIETKINSGHGATLTYGYKKALSEHADYIFQTDSDGQTVPQEFWEFWCLRSQFDFIIGERTNRQDGLSRIMVTKVLKIILKIIFKVSIPDANTPFRLMNAKTLENYIEKIPDEYNLTNIMLTVLMLKDKVKTKFIPISFKQRQGGKNSINIPRICKIGLRAVSDFKKFQA